MKRASVTEAKNQLSALLDRVRQGESVVIEDRGIAVAHLQPVAQQSAAADDDRLARLERQGVLRPAATAKLGQRLQSAPPRPRSGKAVRLSDLVRAERGEGW
jgi:prevent-host-death family protein